MRRATLIAFDQATVWNADTKVKHLQMTGDDDPLAIGHDFD
jgi:hypothetical protein